MSDQYDTDQPISVTADFATAVDYPLIKTKFSAFNSGYVPVERYERDAHLFEPLRMHSFRHESGWGGDLPPYGWSRQPITGTADDLSYDFEELDRIAAALLRHDILPYWSHSYTPTPLQKGGDWRSAPTDLDAWRRVHRQVAAHLREAGLPAAAHEVSNEPDLRDERTGEGVFFNGTQAEYFEMYRHGVAGLLEGDPDAVVGGPAIAYTGDNSWIHDFLAFVKANDLPLNFFSFHAYGSASLCGAIERMRDGLAADPRFDTTEMHLNEWNPFLHRPSDSSGPVDHHAAAAQLLSDFHELLEYPCITEVHWAQGMDPRDRYEHIGVVGLEGQRKAAYNAWQIYARLPVDRRRVTINAPEGATGLGGMAACNRRAAGLVLWNCSDSDRVLTVALQNLPFARGVYRVYRIDREHASVFDNPKSEALAPVETHPNIVTGDLDWQGVLPANAVVYLEITDEAQVSEPPPFPQARIIRQHHYYPDRRASCYAHFDRRTWTARLGMGHAQRGTAMVGVTVEQLPDVLRVTTQVDGALRTIDTDSMLGLRLDYVVGGVAAQGVLFHGPYYDGPDLYNPQRDAVIPWGTRRAPDRAIQVDDLAEFSIRLAEHAPAGWEGRIILTCIMQHAGADTRAKIVIRAD